MIFLAALQQCIYCTYVLVLLIFVNQVCDNSATSEVRCMCVIVGWLSSRTMLQIESSDQAGTVESS